MVRSAGNTNTTQHRMTVPSPMFGGKLLVISFLLLECAYCIAWQCAPPGVDRIWNHVMAHSSPHFNLLEDRPNRQQNDSGISKPKLSLLNQARKSAKSDGLYENAKHYGVPAMHTITVTM
eukprot:scaffold151739_cov54-Attheya_sp.AAC.3